MCVAGDERKRGAEQLCCVGGVGLLRFAALDLIGDFVEARVRIEQVVDGGTILLDEAEEWNVRKIRWEASFDEGFGLVLFGRIELREARAENVCLPIVSLEGDGVLFDLVFDHPDLRPVIVRGVTDQDDLH